MMIERENTPVSIRSLSSEYKKKCRSKIEYHSIQARSSKLWSDLFKITKLISSSSSIITMSLMTINNFESYQLAITGSCFIFFNGILDKLMESYNFDLISNQNYVALDDFKDILLKLEVDILEEGNKQSILIEKYLLLESKFHVSPVKECWLGCLYQ